MKKLIVSIVLILVLTFSVAAIAKKSEKKADGKSKVECKTKGKCGSKDKSDAKCDSKGKLGKKGRKGRHGKYVKLHKDVIVQLKKIRDIAVKEKATETVKALDEFIAKKQKKFDKMKEKFSKRKDCADKKDSEACSGSKDSKSCPVNCTKPCCAAVKPKDEHPKSEHPTSEHPTSEHPK